MKINNFFKKGAVMIALLSVGLAVSCSDSESVDLTKESVVDEALMDYYYEDLDDMSNISVGITSETYTGTAGGRVDGNARTITSNEGRLKCATITVELLEGNTIEIPKGKITIDFGTDGVCKDLRGNFRKGKVIISFTGRRFISGSTVVVTLENYSINDVKIEGTRTLTNISTSSEDAPQFRISLVGGKIHWLDGTITEREHYFIRKWVRGDKEDLADDELQISYDDASGKSYTAAGTNRFGKIYTMKINKTLIYKRCSPIAVEGVKEFSDGEKIVTIDYGVKTDCDRKFTITIAGDTRVVGA